MEPGSRRSAPPTWRGGRRVGFPAFAGDEVWWQESRPAESGRHDHGRPGPDGPAASCWPPRGTPAPGCTSTAAGHTCRCRRRSGFDLVFANFSDQRLYRWGRDGVQPEPLPLTPGRTPAFRFADLVLSPGGDEIWCVRERHGEPGRDRPGQARDRGGPARRLGRGDPEAIRVLVSGADFFAFPTPSPDGTKLAWINWDHPRMPWDGTELRVAAPATARRRSGPSALIMGGPRSRCWPRAGATTSLYAISDASGWWNLYVADLLAVPRAAVPGRGGVRRAALAARRQPVRAARRRPAGGGARPRRAAAGGARPGDRDAGRLRPARLPDGGPGLPCPAGRRQRGRRPGRPVGGAAGRFPARRAATAGRRDARLRQTAGLGAGPRLSAGRAPGPATGRGGRSCTPSSTRRPIRAARAPDGELPPFIVCVHGGPTSQRLPLVDLEKAFFTSRGIGVIDVNYGGSTGYGRAYRELLRGQWGIVDVADAMTRRSRWPTPARRTEAARHPGRLGRRLDGARRGDVGAGSPAAAEAGSTRRNRTRRCSGRDVLLRRVRPARRSPPRPTTSSRATWTG